MPRFRLFAAAAACALAAGSAVVEPFTFVAIGDMPYRLPDDYARFERLIARINKDRARLHRPCGRHQERQLALHRREFPEDQGLFWDVRAALGLHARRQRVDRLPP